MALLMRIVRILGIFILLLLFVAVCLFSWIDRDPYIEEDYYKQTLDGFSEIDTSQLMISGDPLKIGWAKRSIVPSSPVPLAGYGIRHGALLEGVHDSIWVKGFVFENGVKEYAYVSMDLLIVPMEVTLLLDKKLDSVGINPDNVFLTASHSHCSIGGWGTGIAGELFAGAYDPDIVEFIANATVNTIIAAKNNLESAQIGYSEIQASDLVTNRLVGDQKGTIDPWIRVMKMTKNSGETALLNIFSAHATCLRHRFREVSNDYPGQLCRNLEILENVDFAVFSAGAMGSMAPLVPAKEGWPKVEYFAEQMSEQIALVQNFMPVHYDSLLGHANLDLFLRDPQFKISENFRLRPWVFESLFGSYPSQITSFRIGDILFVGTPCDFSGELVDSLSKRARDKGLHLVITSFNGGYIGYVTKDEWYDLDEYETRTMNWFGPYNGAYFSELIEKLIDLHASQSR